MRVEYPKAPGGALMQTRECIYAHSQQDYDMNQTIVVDVIPITHHSIDLWTASDTGNNVWAVHGHGDGGFKQLIDLYPTLLEAEEAYPEAWCSLSETEDYDWPSDTIPQ